jgi:formate dehydrogenase subunit beta
VADEREARLRERVEELLSEGKVKLVVGYGTGASGEVRPMLVRTPEEARKLVWNSACVHNLASYLTHPPVAGVLRGGEKVGVVVKGCDARAVVTLIQERQIGRDQVHVIGMVCDGVADPRSDRRGLAVKCGGCEVCVPLFYDDLIGDASRVKRPPGSALEDIEEFLAKSDDERWAFWKQQMEKCIRCYACRQACPLCYCKECITEKARPQWVDRAPLPRGNLAYHVVRAMHLAGRCSSCGECTRVCPVGIPVDMLNRFLTNRIKEAFGHECGVDCEADLFQTTFGRDTDPEGFIR